jgi:ubiquinone/menaquinone biosynthesis C-methylase UbiE
VSLHPSVHGFGRSAAAYERGRPDYPAAAVEWLCSGMGVDDSSTVVDLAAGTGKLTRALLPRVGRVVAIEPVDGMREKLSELLPEVEARPGTAEEMRLPDACADGVAVGQAFHWFDGDRALAEIHRVLRVGGGLGLIWNRRDLEHPVHAELQRMLQAYRGDTPAERAEQWRAAFERTTLFTPLVERHFDHAQEVDAAALVDRIGSTSFVASLKDAEREPFLAKVRALVPEGESISLPYITGVHVCRAL